MFHLLLVMPFVTNCLCTGYNEITVHNYIFCGKETNAQTCCPTTALTLTSTATQALAATKIVNVCDDVNATATAAATATATATATLSATAFGHEKCSADNWKSSAWKSLAPFSGFA